MAGEAKHVGVKPTIDSQDYRRFPADTFGLRVNNNSAQLTFSLETADAVEREFISREATAVMTLPSLKVLQLILTNTIATFEKQVGPITLAPGKEEELSAKLGQVFGARKDPPESGTQPPKLGKP